MSRSSSKDRSFQQLPFEEIASLWHDRFGIDEQLFSGCSFYRRGRMIWAFGLPNLPECSLPKLVFETVGLRIMSIRNGPWKPTTYALQLWGRHATKNVIHLDYDQTVSFMAGRSIMVSRDGPEGYPKADRETDNEADHHEAAREADYKADCMAGFKAGCASGYDAGCDSGDGSGCEAGPEDSCEGGYVIAVHDGAVLGCGLYSRGKLISQIPKERRIMEDDEGVCGGCE